MPWRRVPMNLTAHSPNATTVRTWQTCQRLAPGGGSQTTVVHPSLGWLYSQERIRKPRPAPLAVNNVALLAPLRSVQFSGTFKVQFSSAIWLGLHWVSFSFFDHHIQSSVVGLSNPKGRRHEDLVVPCLSDRCSVRISDPEVLFYGTSTAFRAPP